MKQYVLGFMFSEDTKRVALIRKNKPTWQAGFFNGIGGKVEEDDLSYNHAMAREFGEETGYETDAKDWRLFLCMSNSQFEVYTFVAIGNVDLVKTTTDEIVRVVDVASLSEYQTIQNLKWLIPMATDSKEFAPVEVHYNEEEKYNEPAK